MFCNIVFWIVAAELINFEIKYPYIYLFGISCNTWIGSLSEMISMICMYIIPHALP